MSLKQRTDDVLCNFINGKKRISKAATEHIRNLFMQLRLVFEYTKREVTLSKKCFE